MTVETMDNSLDDLDVLLRDIYEYLKKRKENPTLSTDDRQLAEILIDRSKQQLQKIAIRKNKENEHTQDDRYVDMSKNSNEPPPPLPVKKPVPAPQPIIPLLSETECPYKDLPAKQISNEVKHGTLSIRKKMFNIIGCSSKVYGAIQENWLLMYGSSKDAKPFCVLDLNRYEAKEDESDPTVTELDITRDGGLKKTSNKMASSFKVFQSMSPEKKSYSFVATTHKDMLQWVVHINRSHDKAVRESKGLGDLVYDYCQNPQDNPDDENIYNEIEMPQFKPLTIPINEEPTKKPSIPRSLPEIPTSHSSLSSNEEIYQELGPIEETISLGSIMTDDSFDKEEEEDETYYELDAIRSEAKRFEKNVEDKENLESNSSDAPPSLPKESDTIQINKDAFEITDNKNIKLESTLPESTSKRESKMSNKCVNGIRSLQIKKDRTNSASKKPDLPLKKENLKINLSAINTPRKVSAKTKLNSPVKETSTVTVRESSNSHASSPKANHSIVQIIRQRFSTMESQNRNLGTFSRNSKLETFQASPSRDSAIVDDFKDVSKPEIDDYLSPIKPVNIKSNKKSDNDNEKPMVLLKPDIGEEDESTKKLRKSPISSCTTKKVAKKLQF
ncbi:unnamed protein product [Ceutorhynchus assimilis]|uniref:PH domain-containing protein n=1 Tax=Ceutorhynchus assimilis TaxID=467358 RepID=A0A9N9QHZ3_9CUCU|nr:unnamed protein product [Ceutorhynchus assimilis]